MIEWMQKHKKWLVITIWVSTIAFIGAGFVGWGSYQFGRSSSTILKVGDFEVSIKEFQKEYASLYNQYAIQYKKIFNQDFNKELAKKFDLETKALNNLKQKYYLLNLAKEYDLSATPVEIAKVVLANKAFYKNNKFDKNTYQKVLKQNGFSISEYENSIAQDIIISKLLNIYKQNVSLNELDKIKKIFFAKDKIAYNIIDLSKINPKVTLNQIKKFYEKNKQNYKSNKKYICKVAKVKIKDEKVSKKEALKKYIALKKNKEKFDSTIEIDEIFNSFDPKDFDKIKKAKIGQVLKPIKVKDEYLILKVSSIKKPQILPFKKVKEQVKIDLIDKLKLDLANKKRDKLINNFKANKVVWLDRTNLAKIKGLNKQEVMNLTAYVANSVKKINFVNLGNKIVVYKILDSNLTSPSKPELEVRVNDSLNSIKNKEILVNLIKKLSQKIEILEYYK